MYTLQSMYDGDKNYGCYMESSAWLAYEFIKVVLCMLTFIDRATSQLSACHLDA